VCIGKYLVLMHCRVCTPVVKVTLEIPVCICVVLCLYVDDLLKLLNDFYRRPEVRRLAAENGLDGQSKN